MALFRTTTLPPGAARRRGVAWGLLAACLWGSWYWPAGVLWQLSPVAEFATRRSETFLAMAILLGALQSGMVLLLLLGALALQRQSTVFWRQLRHAPAQGRSLWLAAFCGGLLGNGGVWLALGYGGASFAVLAGLLCPLIAAGLSPRCDGGAVWRRWLALLMLLLSGLMLYAPTLLQRGRLPEWPGLVGAGLAALGWGLEGVLAARAMPGMSSDRGVTLRYLAEVTLWLGLLPLLAAALPLRQALHVPLALGLPAWGLVLAAAASFGLCALAWYRAIPLLGAGPAQGLVSLYALFATLMAAVASWTLPSGWALAALLPALLGVGLLTRAPAGRTQGDSA